MHITFFFSPVHDSTSVELFIVDVLSDLNNMVWKTSSAKDEANA